MDKAALQKQFLFLAHLSDAGCKGVREELEERLEEFLRAGIELKPIMDILGDEGVFYNYDTLAEYGAYINLCELAKNLGGDFVYENLDTFLTITTKADELLTGVYDCDSFREICEENSAEDFFFRLICHGVKAKTIFLLADAFLRDLTVDPVELFRALSFFVGYGLEQKIVKKWLSDRLKENCFEILKYGTEYAKVLKSFGIDIRDFTEAYLKRYGYDHLANSTAKPLPNWINMNTFIKHIPMRKIIDDGGPEFIYNFEKNCGDMDKLAVKFIKEIGYPKDYADAFVLLIIVECGGGLAAINFDKFAESVDATQLNPADKECFKETLSRYVTEAEKLQKFN